MPNPQYQHTNGKQFELDNNTLSTRIGTPPQLTHLPITNLSSSPRNSQSSFTMPNDLTRSIRSLQSFKDLFVQRKRISIGIVLREGLLLTVYQGSCDSLMIFSDHFNRMSTQFGIDRIFIVYCKCILIYSDSRMND